jgi:hypothetical protein
MKNMRAKERTSAEWGFRVPTPGWHQVCFQEGIDVLTNANSGKQSVMVPASIDEGSADDGIRVSVFCPYKDDQGAYSEFGEQKLADILSAVGLFGKFEEMYPGDTSLFEPEILDKVKIKLPGLFCKVKLELSTDGKYSNVVGIAAMNVEVKNTPAKAAPAAKAEAPAAKKNVEW